MEHRGTKAQSFLINNYFRHGVTEIVNKTPCLRVSVFALSGLNPST